MAYKLNPFSGKLDIVIDRLSKLKDVTLTDAADHETLYYDLASATWKNNDTLKIDVDNSVIIKAGKKLIFDGD